MIETEVCPAALTVITPPHEHEHCDESSSAATLPIVTWLAPGVHGWSTGTHGCGVKTPRAALVAAATCGLASEVHIPNGGRLLAAVSDTTPAALVAWTSVLEAEKVDGDVPNEHWQVAPVLTCVGIADSLQRASCHVGESWRSAALNVMALR